MFFTSPVLGEDTKVGENIMVGDDESFGKLGQSVLLAGEVTGTGGEIFSCFWYTLVSNFALGEDSDNGYGGDGDGGERAIETMSGMVEMMVEC